MTAMRVIAAALTALAVGTVMPAWAEQPAEFPQVPAVVLAHGVDRLDEAHDPMSSPDADLGDDRAWGVHHLVEVAVDQQQAARLWRRHGAPGPPPVLAVHHVLAAVRIDHGGASPCYRRRFDAAWELGTAIDLVLPNEENEGACDQPYGPGTGSQHDVYVIDLDVSRVSPDVGVVRVSAAFGGGGLQYVAETAVDLPVAPMLPQTGMPVAWLALAGLLGVTIGAGTLARSCRVAPRRRDRPPPGRGDGL